MITVDAKNSIYQAVAIRGENIQAVGKDSEVLDLTGPQTVLIDLQGHTVIPGIIDGIPVWSGRINEVDYSQQWSIRNYLGILPEFQHLPEDFRRSCHQVAVFPYLFFTLYPDCTKYIMTIPESVNTTRVISGFYGLLNSRREVKITRYLTGRVNQQLKLQREDISRKLQQGLESNVNANRMVGISDSNTNTFHCSIQDILPVARILQEPKNGSLEDINRLLSERQSHA